MFWLIFYTLYVLDKHIGMTNVKRRHFVRLSRWSRSWQYPRVAAEGERRRHRSGACWALLNRARNSFTSAQHVASTRGWERWKQTVPGDTIHSSYLSRLQSLYDTREYCENCRMISLSQQTACQIAVASTKTTTFIATVRRPTGLAVLRYCNFHCLLDDTFVTAQRRLIHKLSNMSFQTHNLCTTRNIWTNGTAW